MVAETRLKSEESDKKFDKMVAETRQKSEESDKKFDKMVAETRQKSEEADKKFDKMVAETRLHSEKADKRLNKLGKYLGGIAHSNGEMAEAYFYNAFKKDKTFVQEKFDYVQRPTKITNGEVEAEFDILLFNGTSVAMIEVKYNAKPENVSIKRLISRVALLKILYPNYKNHKIYLGVAAMSFKENFEDELHANGIATICQIGKKMVVFDKDVKVF
jgi:hypothetical protein